MYKDGHAIMRDNWANREPLGPLEEDCLASRDRLCPSLLTPESVCLQHLKKLPFDARN